MAINNKPVTFFQLLLKNATVSMLVFVILTFTLSLLVTPRFTDKLSHEYLSQISQYIINDNKFLFLSGDDEAVERLVKRIVKMPWIAHAAIYNASTEKMTHHSDTNQPLPTFSNEAGFKRRDGLRLFVADINYVYRTPKGVANEKIDIGFLQVAMSNAPVRSMLYFILQVVLGVSLFSALCLYPLLRRLAERLSRPIQQLHEQLKKVGVQDDDVSSAIKISSSSRDLEDVTTAINQLLRLNHQYQREIEDKLEFRTAQLEQAENQKIALISGMSHDLKTPLTAVKGYVQLAQGQLKKIINADRLSDENDKDPLAKAFKSLEKATSSTVQLHQEINQMLNYSISESVDIIIEKTYFDIKALIHQSIERFDTVASSVNTKISYTHAGALMIMSDATLIQHIIDNLLANALKFCKNGTVYISTDTADELTIEVRDTGLGIESYDLDRIFLPGYVSRHQKTGTGLHGTGIGLSLCQRYAESLGGTISVTSKPGEGACFTIQIPVEY